MFRYCERRFISILTERSPGPSIIERPVRSGRSDRKSPKPESPDHAPENLYESHVVLFRPDGFSRPTSLKTNRPAGVSSFEYQLNQFVGHRSRTTEVTGRSKNDFSVHFQSSRSTITQLLKAGKTLHVLCPSQPFFLLKI